MSINKIYLTSTSKCIPYINFSDIPKPIILRNPFKNFEITHYQGNTVESILSSSVFKNAIENDYITAYDEDGEPIDLLVKAEFIDLVTSSFTDGDTLAYNNTTGKFEPIPSGGGVGGSDSFLKVPLNNTVDQTINHSFGREAVVRIIEGGREVIADISYPVGFETSRVRIMSDLPINGFAILV